MAPRAKTVANGLKRKAAEDAGPQEPPKRTRSSGLSPSHFVPLEGAPTLPKSHSSFLPREPDATPSHKRKPTRSSGSAQSRSRKSSRDLQADRAEQNSSTEATSEDEIALKSTHKRPENIASPRKSGNFVAKVEISARKLTPITYKRVGSYRKPPPLPDSDDELLLQSSPTKSTNKRAMLPHSALRSTSNIATNDRSVRETARPTDHSSPIKRARFLSPSLSDTDTDDDVSTPHNRRTRKASNSVSSTNPPPIHPPPGHNANARGSRKNIRADSSLALPVPQQLPSASGQSALPASLARELQPFLVAQKTVSLGLLRGPCGANPGGAGEENEAVNSLLSLLQGTIIRGEGNSCVVLGPRGSGKTTAVEEVISRLEHQADIKEDPTLKPIVIRLSGHVHVNDRIALMEIGRQLISQNGPSNLSLPQLEDNEDEIESDAEDDEAPLRTRFASLMPPPSHMSSLVTTMSTLPRPTIVVLDAFDLFTSHARQALLYCLLDTVQSCRAGEGRKGVAVVGITTRVDTLNLLEKRVKSRFSHRIIKCPSITSLEAFIANVKAVLTKTFTLQEAVDLVSARYTRLEPQALEKWQSFWNISVESCLVHRETKRVLKENFELTRDVRLLNNVLASALLTTSPTSPWLLPGMIADASKTQRASDAWSFLCDLPFPPLALLVASFHLQTAGHDTFTFEHVFHVYSRAARQSTSTNISLDGVVIGLPKASRDIMAGAFENLISCKVFQPSGASSASTSFQFKKYRCDVSRQDVKAAIEAKAHTQLKRWLSRPT